MSASPQTQAILLLTVAFTKPDVAGANPLSKGEWARLALWLRDHGLYLGSLLKGDLPSLLAGWMDGSVSVARLQALLGRGAALGFALEKWQRAGLWVLTCSDPDYPERCTTASLGCAGRPLRRRQQEPPRPAASRSSARVTPAKKTLASPPSSGKRRPARAIRSSPAARAASTRPPCSAPSPARAPPSACCRKVSSNRRRRPTTGSTSWRATWR